MPGVEGAVLGLIEEVVGLLDLDELYAGLVIALRRAVPSDWASVNDVGPGPGDFTAIAEPEVRGELLEVFGRLKDQNPLIQRYNETRDGRAYRFSDAISRARFHSLPIYREFYAPLGSSTRLRSRCPPVRIGSSPLRSAEAGPTTAITSETSLTAAARR